MPEILATPTGSTQRNQQGSSHMTSVVTSASAARDPATGLVNAPGLVITQQMYAFTARELVIGQTNAPEVRL